MSDQYDGPELTRQIYLRDRKIAALEAELAIVTKDRDSLLETFGTTPKAAAARLNAMRFPAEKQGDAGPLICGYFIAGRAGNPCPRCGNGPCPLINQAQSETTFEVTGGGGWANGQAPYVCDLPYLPESNALANCKACGWPIAKHNMVDQFAKGPFAPKTGADAK